jgi:hypothetical protein
MIYELYGVVTHLGESGEGGHFIASCKSPSNNKWYRFNDAIVSPINDIQSEIINLINIFQIIIYFIKIFNKINFYMFLKLNNINSIKIIIYAFNKVAINNLNKVKLHIQLGGETV